MTGVNRKVSTCTLKPDNYLWWGAQFTTSSSTASLAASTSSSASISFNSASCKAGGNQS